jgi:hypothetical protein
MALFTKETAAEMARRSHVARNAAVHEPEPIAIQPHIADHVADSAPSFAQLRLIRVRAQLDKIDALMAECSDTKQLKELADAAHRLQEQERVLDGRPLPGSRKPAPERNPRKQWIGDTGPTPIPDTTTHDNQRANSQSPTQSVEASQTPATTKEAQSGSQTQGNATPEVRT